MMCRAQSPHRAGAAEESQQQTGGQVVNAMAEEQAARRWGKVT